MRDTRDALQVFQKRSVLICGKPTNEERAHRHAESRVFVEGIAITILMAAESLLLKIRSHGCFSSG